MGALNVGPSVNVGSAAHPALRLVSNKEIDEKNAEKNKAYRAPLIGLASYLDKCWEEAKRAKEPIDRMNLSALRQRKGEYDPDVLADIKSQGGSEIYMMLTATKVRSAKAWLMDIHLPGGDEKAWSISPSPIADLSPDILQVIHAEVARDAMQFAARTGQPMGQGDISGLMEHYKESIKQRVQEEGEKAAVKMERKIEDVFDEGGFDGAMVDFLDDLVTFKAAFLKGNVIRKVPTLKWQRTQQGYQPVVSKELQRCYERRSPFDIFPSPGSTSLDDGYFFDRHRLSIKGLNALRGAPGYDEEAIQSVIDEYGRGGLRQWMAHDYEKSVLEYRQNEQANSASMIDALEFYGEVPGFLLIDWGLSSEKVPDPTISYEVNAWKVGRWIIKADINQHPLKGRGYYKASYESIPGAFWGKAVPELMQDDAQMCNAAARSLANNMGIASGPQVFINDTTRLPPGEDINSMHPWKLWQFGPDQSGGSSHRPPIGFFQPQSNVNELMGVYEKFMALADEHTNIPAYSHGSTSVGGAGSTASGLSMLIGQATKAFKSVVSNIDENIIKRLVTDTYISLMQWDPDPSIKGDLKVVATASSALMVKEQMQMRRKEFLDSTNNPTDMQIIGLAGRAEILRETARALQMDVNKIVPQKEQTGSAGQGGADPAQAGNPMPGQQPGAPAELMPGGAPAGGGDQALFQQA